MEDAPAGARAESTTIALGTDNKCDCSCSRGLLCARKGDALEKRASLVASMQDVSPQRTTGGPS